MPAARCAMARGLGAAARSKPARSRDVATAAQARNGVARRVPPSPPDFASKTPSCNITSESKAQIVVVCNFGVMAPVSTRNRRVTFTSTCGVLVLKGRPALLAGAGQWRRPRSVPENARAFANLGRYGLCSSRCPRGARWANCRSWHRYGGRARKNIGRSRKLSLGRRAWTLPGACGTLRRARPPCRADGAA